MINSVIAVNGVEQETAKAYLDILSSAMRQRGSVGNSILKEEIVLGNAVSSCDGEICISFEGRLYGEYSNAQTVIEAYEQEGTSFLEKLDGSFAFCLWDNRRKLLIVARDRFGIKPLFYMKVSDALVFASELNALLSLNPSFDPNQKLICEYLLSGNYPRNGQTFFTGIYELLPGHFMQISDSTSLKQKPYCTFPILKFDDYKKDNIESEYEELINQTIKKILPQNEKFAISVSGGLDSTLLASKIRQYASQKDYEMYSVVCEGASYKQAELPYIKEYERYINEDITYLVVPLPPKWIDLQNYLRQTSEPAPILNYYMFHLMSKQLEREKIKFVVMGHGADTFMIGNMTEHIQYLEYLWKHNKLSFFIESLAFFVKQDYTVNIRERISSYIKYILNKSRNISKLTFLNPVFVKNNFEEKIPTAFDTVAELLQYSDNFDRVYTSQGIEFLSPFLDGGLVEYTADLPSSVKVRWGVRKYLLRQVAKGLVPEAIRKCKRKFPSSIPLSIWLVAWKDEVTELLNSDEFSKRRYYDAKLVREFYQKLLNNELDTFEEDIFAYKLWRIVNLEIWLRQNEVPLGNR